MGSRVLMVRGTSLSFANRIGLWHGSNRFSIQHRLLKFPRFLSKTKTTCSSIESPDVPRLAKTAQISLTPTEVEEFGPKIQQVVDWFGQLQGVDLQSIEPSIRADTENNLRDNAPQTFEHRDVIIASVPSYEKPYIKVPKVLNMD